MGRTVLMAWHLFNGDFLWIHEFVLDRSIFSTVRLVIACSSPRGVSWLLFANENDYTIFGTWGVVMTWNDENFEMHTWKLKQIDFFRPCRGLSTWKGASPVIWDMTRRALALRVIPLQGQFAFEWAETFWWPGTSSMAILFESMNSFWTGVFFLPFVWL